MSKNTLFASLISLIILLSLGSEALAHSGRTDSKGCHRETKTGTYHCH